MSTEVKCDRCGKRIRSNDVIITVGDCSSQEDLCDRCMIELHTIKEIFMRNDSTFYEIIAKEELKRGDHLSYKDKTFLKKLLSCNTRSHPE